MQYRFVNTPMDRNKVNGQRNQFRANVDRAIVIKLSNGKSIQARLINLSTSGLAIRYPAAGEIGAELGLIFQLPEENNLVTICSKGIVRHSHVFHEDFITGIEFLNLNEADTQRIAKFLNARLGTKHPTGIVVSHRHRG